MKTTVTIAKALSLTALMATSAIAGELPSKLNGLRIAVVKDALGSRELSTGDYSTAANMLTKTSTTPQASYEKSMGLCVAYIKLEQHDAANIACSDAITSLDSVKTSKSQAKYLTSIAYSNRAIAKYLAKDNQGALEDMTEALLIDNNTIVKGNLVSMKGKLFAKHDETATEFAYSISE